MNESSYPPISDYAFIADCHSSALVSSSGSIDWCCMPRVDSGSCFGRLLDWRKGGFCQIVPKQPFEVSRRYIEGTLVLETIFSFWLVDCLARQQRLKEAQRVFERALSTGNDLGLFAEEYDPRQSLMLGNFPQALTHLSLITAILAISERVPADWSYDS